MLDSFVLLLILFRLETVFGMMLLNNAKGVIKTILSLLFFFYSYLGWTIHSS